MDYILNPKLCEIIQNIYKILKSNFQKNILYLSIPYHVWIFLCSTLIPPHFAFPTNWQDSSYLKHILTGILENRVDHDQLILLASQMIYTVFKAGYIPV